MPSISRNTVRDLKTYALIGLAATPIALIGGEGLAAVFCIVAVLVSALARKRSS